MIDDRGRDDERRLDDRPVRRREHAPQRCRPRMNTAGAIEESWNSSEPTIQMASDRGCVSRALSSAPTNAERHDRPPARRTRGPEHRASGDVGSSPDGQLRHPFGLHHPRTVRSDQSRREPVIDVQRLSIQLEREQRLRIARATARDRTPCTSRAAGATRRAPNRPVVAPARASSIADAHAAPASLRAPALDARDREHGLGLTASRAARRRTARASSRTAPSTIRRQFGSTALSRTIGAARGLVDGQALRPDRRIARREHRQRPQAAAASGRPSRA